MSLVSYAMLIWTDTSFDLTQKAMNSMGLQSSTSAYMLTSSSPFPVRMYGTITPCSFLCIFPDTKHLEPTSHHSPCLTLLLYRERSASPNIWFCVPSHSLLFNWKKRKKFVLDIIDPLMGHSYKICSFCNQVLGRVFPQVPGSGKSGFFLQLCLLNYCIFLVIVTTARSTNSGPRVATSVKQFVTDNPSILSL